MLLRMYIALMFEMTILGAVMTLAMQHAVRWQTDIDIEWRNWRDEAATRHCAEWDAAERNIQVAANYWRRMQPHQVAVIDRTEGELRQTARRRRHGCLPSSREDAWAEGGHCFLVYQESNLAIPKDWPNWRVKSCPRAL